jgi:uncharacterized protein YggE
MIYRTVNVVLAAWLAIVLCPAAGRAQVGAPQGELGPGAGTVSGTGTATVTKKATLMRVHVQLVGKGKGLEEALANLKERREAARTALQTLGAEKASISFGDPSLFNPEAQNRRQFERMVRQRMAAAGRKPKGLKLPHTFTVSATLKAEWRLPPEEPEKLLLAVNAIQEKVKAADLGGAKQAQKLSPEEQETAEEMAQMMSDMGQEQADPAEPQFLFVARITEEERQQALSRAFAKARAQAARLARAAGAELGPLVSLMGQGAGNSDYINQMMYNYSPYGRSAYLQRMMTQQAAELEEEAGKMAAGPDSGGLVFQFQVSATFSLKKKQ